MGFIKDRISIKNQYGINDQQFLAALGLDSTDIDNNKLGEITFFICLNFLSQCMGKLPIKKYTIDNVKGKIAQRTFDMDYLLNVEPNPYMTAPTFWETVELNRNYWGNSYVYIEQINGIITALWILPTESMQILCDNAGIFGQKNAIWYKYTDGQTAKQYIFSMDEVMHFRSSISFDGISGLAIKDIIKLQIDSRKYGEQYIANLYKNNMFSDKVLVQYTGDIDDTKGDKLAERLERFSKHNSGKFIPLPLGVTASTLSMKLSDAEFTELNKMSALELAACFGIKPNIINNYDKSSYSNSETQQLDFYINSLSPILKQYDAEISRKLLTSIEKKNTRYEHDIEELFKMDSNTLMTYLQKGVNNFIISPNEAREKINLPWVDGGDELIGNGNYIKMSQIGNQYIKNIGGGENV